MSTTLTDLGLDRLSVDDRLALLSELWDSIPNDTSYPSLSESEERVIESRIADLDSNPENVLTWDEIKQSLRDKR